MATINDKDEFERNLTILRNAQSVLLWDNITNALKNQGVEIKEWVYRVKLDNRSDDFLIFSNISIGSNDFNKTGKVRIIKKEDFLDKKKTAVSLNRTSQLYANILKTLNKIK